MCYLVKPSCHQQLHIQDPWICTQTMKLSFHLSLTLVTLMQTGLYVAHIFLIYATVHIVTYKSDAFLHLRFPQSYLTKASANSGNFSMKFLCSHRQKYLTPQVPQYFNFIL